MRDKGRGEKEKKKIGKERRWVWGLEEWRFNSIASYWFKVNRKIEK